MKTRTQKLARQVELMEVILAKANVNMVTCGSCGSVLLHDKDDEEVDCPHCDFQSDPCDFPDFYYSNMGVSEVYRETISKEAELNGDDIEDNFWEVTFLDDIFTATSNADGNVRRFKLLKSPNELTDDERYSVLNYTLAKVTPEDEVDLRDIFLQAEFIKEI